MVSAESITAIEVDLTTATVFVRGEKGILLWRRECGSKELAMDVAARINAKWVKKLEEKQCERSAA